MIFKSRSGLGAIFCLFLAASGRAQEPRTATMTPALPVFLSELEGLALSGHPGGAARQAAEAAARSLQAQAAARPNPELSLEAEDIATGQDGGRFDEASWTVELSQTLELGGKRPGRQRLAEMEAELLRWGNRAEELDLLASVRTRYLALLEAQERLALRQAASVLARQVRDGVAERVRAGKDSGQVLRQAAMESARHDLEVIRAQGVVERSRIALIEQLGSHGRQIEGRPVAGDLRELPTLPAWPEVQPLLSDNPSWQQAVFAEQAAQEAVAQERREAVPDLTVSVGYTYERGSQEHLAKVGVSLPLPIFDRRRGHREAARHHLSQVGAEAAAVRLVLHSELRQAWQEAATAMAAVAAIRQGLLVETRQLLQEAEESYRQGKSSYLELLNAQQTWQELNLEYIDALAEAHRHLVAIDRLTARPTTPPSSQQQKGNNP